MSAYKGPYTTDGGAFQQRGPSEQWERVPKYRIWRYFVRRQRWRLRRLFVHPEHDTYTAYRTDKQRAREVLAERCDPERTLSEGQNATQNLTGTQIKERYLHGNPLGRRPKL